MPIPIPAEKVERDRAYAAAKAICRHHAKSFYFCSFFLPMQKRLDAYAVYAFCRLLDDAVDENPGKEAEGIARFEGILDAVYQSADDALSLSSIEGAEDANSAPAIRAFAETVRRCEIPKRYFLDLAEGCRMDLTITRYASWAELEKYCYHVAGVVGLIMCRVFGLKDEAALAQAVQMGNAMQLTNILRDVKEDLDRGRVYLPADELRRFNITDDQLSRGEVSSQFVELMKFEIDRARSLYREAARGLRCLDDDGSRLTACAMGVIYSGILGAIERQAYDVFSRRARINLLQKLLRIGRARRLCRRDDEQTVRRAFE